MGKGRWQRRRLVLVFAAPAALADLGLKAATSHPFVHARSGAVVALTALVAVALVVFVPRLASRAAAIAAGLGAGGAAANALSALMWGPVPDPLVVTVSRTTVAFNLADVFAVAGAGALLAAAAIYVLRHPGALGRPV
jgi:lipoprotein signal peptidase